MRRLKKTTRVDHIKTEVRVQRGSLGKWIYLCLLLVLGLWLFNLFFGHYFYLKAHGMVVREVTTLGLSYSAQIRRLPVYEGAEVGRGDVLMEVVSMDVVRQLSELGLELSALDVKRGGLQSEQALIDTTLAMARDRAEQMNLLLGQQQKAVREGLTGTQSMSELLQDAFDAKLKYAEMTTRRRVLREEIKQLESSRESLLTLYRQISDIYQQGKVVSEQAGIVANLQVSEGGVIKPGDKVLDVLHGEPYVLAYLDPDALYTVEEGEQVSIVFGSRLLDGRVSRIYGLSTELPKEFQRTFRPLERSTVVRIQLLVPSESPPIMTTVEVLSSGSLLRWVKRWF